MRRIEEMEDLLMTKYFVCTAFSRVIYVCVPADAALIPVVASCFPSPTLPPRRSVG